jgi:hypothetical protein
MPLTPNSKKQEAYLLEGLGGQFIQRASRRVR